jgi:hypothetical protein
MPARGSVPHLCLSKFSCRFSAFVDCRNFAMAVPSGRLAGASNFDSNQNRHFRD